MPETNLAEALALPSKTWERPGVDLDSSNGKGTLTTPPSVGDPDPEGALREFGFDPDDFLIEPVKLKRWQATAKGGYQGSWLSSGTFKITKKISETPLPSLFEAARKKKKRPITTVRTTGRHEVISLSDFQIGKVDVNGGSPELISILMGKVKLMDDYLKKAKPESITIFDLGDLIEGDQTGAANTGMIDLSHPEQLDAAATIVYEFVSTAKRHAPTRVVAVPSNHGRWRNGRQNLGKPTDDYGLHIHRMVQKSIPDVEWVFPEPWSESVVVDVNGLMIGATHGHQYSPQGGPKWWAGQMHGGQSIAQADVLLAGHYHHINIIPTGRNFNGVQKWFIQAPHCETGSSWFANLSGEEADGGILVFAVTEPKLDITTLTVL